MEENGRPRDGTVARKECDSDLTTTLSRWSSEPASLSSGGDDAAGLDLLEQTRGSIATLQHALTAERDRCRRLEVQLESAKLQTSLTPTTFDATLRCIEQERSENRKLHETVQRQQKTVSKLRRQLRVLKLRQHDDDSSISLEDSLDDRDVSMSDFEMLVVCPRCSSCTIDNSRRMVTRSQSDSTVLHRSRISDHSQTSKSAVNVEDQEHCRDAVSEHTVKSGNDDVETLRVRLRATVETCQRLTTALDDAKHRSSTTQYVGRRSSSARNALTPASVDETTQDDDDVKKTVQCSAVDLSTTYINRLNAAEARLKEVEEMNARWQGYMEQREKYTRALELRCFELEQQQQPHRHHHHHNHHHHQQQQLSDEQQRRVDEILLDQRHKTELAEQALIQAQEENRQLRSKVKQLTTVQDQSKVCIDQLLSRLQEVENVRRSEQNTVEALRQQVNAYREDFEGERLDRHRAQERVVNLERQLTALKNRLSTCESNGSNISSQRSRWWQDTVNGSEGSLPLLIARGESSPYPGEASNSLRHVNDRAPRSY